jgi:hypothetical protein
MTLATPDIFLSVARKWANRQGDLPEEVEEEEKETG